MVEKLENWNTGLVYGLEVIKVQVVDFSHSCSRSAFKGTFQHFGKYIYILSVRELDEEFNAALISLY